MNRRGMIVESEGATSTPSHHQKPSNTEDVELGQIVANAVNTTKRKSSNFLNFRIQHWFANWLDWARWWIENI